MLRLAPSSEPKWLCPTDANFSKIQGITRLLNLLEYLLLNSSQPVFQFVFTAQILLDLRQLYFILCLSGDDTKYISDLFTVLESPGLGLVSRSPAVTRVKSLSVTSARASFHFAISFLYDPT